ncbi:MULTISPECIES: Na+/H+ antiporter NhaC family protein [unclassified Treponema]|uniref:Na+/H+ antiporter NhaC family protein n=1 Tax=unclassified Treponema TaxID=2638727 RepID=UPI0005300F33|nr:MULTISPECIES: Na+/H+ antiporter NhaC family protein [unclassified Treponema]AIW89009.1 na+/H+ antiporter nhac [Treponema sp. OMZ 838]UTC51043.1 sodium:proton antiporter [Treponema sp. OMZ 855]
MLELCILLLFSVSLIICVILDYSILYALIFGYALFFTFGLIKGKTWKDMLCYSFRGILTVKNILIIFILIGSITAIWRACGTIAFIVYYASMFAVPQAMVLICFLLCCFVSFLMGTAFGSAATIGVICMTLANSMNIPVIYAGGAVISGIFFGDRCSPMSSGAHLISGLTHTDVFNNIKTMVKTAFIPFIVTAVLYGSIGLIINPGTGNGMTFHIFADSYNLSLFTIIPAGIIILFSLLKIDVKITMTVSCLAGLFCGGLFQHIHAEELIKIVFFGFHPQDAELAKLMTGGGIVSMIRVSIIICISSCYSGMFKGTHFFAGIQRFMERLSKRITAFGSVLTASVFASAIACNQTLAIILTHQVCDDLIEDKNTLASYLENTAVVVAPLMPWSIAVSVPLTSIGAPSVVLVAAFFLYLIPLWNFFVNIVRHRTRK